MSQKLTTNHSIEDAAIDWVMELERLAGRHPVDRRYDAAFAGDIWSDPLTIEVKAIGGKARGWGMPLEAPQVAAAESDLNFVLDIVDNVAQGDPTVFRHRRFAGDDLRRLVANKRERTYFEVPVPVAVFDAAPEHPSLERGPVTTPEQRPEWAVAIGATRMSSTAIVLAETTVWIATVRVEYERWPGPKLTWQETYGKTPLVGADGNRTCAEVAVVSALRSVGWEAWWIDSFGQAPAHWRSFIARLDDLPSAVRLRGGTRTVKGGPWDVAAWRGTDSLFLECKGAGDRIRESQAQWLGEALAAGSATDDFGIVNYVVRS